MPNPIIRIAVLCDDVRHEKAGKVSLMGLFDSFYVADFTQSLPSFHVFMRLAFPQEGQHEVTLTVRSYEGDFRVGLQAAVDAKNIEEATGQYHAIVSAALNNLKVPREGKYQIDVACDGAQVHTIPFKVNTLRPPMVQ